jgi:hypothetical protein
MPPEKPKTRITLSDDDIESAGISDSKVGDSVTLTITGTVVSDNQNDSGRDKSIEVDNVSSSTPSEDASGEEVPGEEPADADENGEGALPPPPPPPLPGEGGDDDSIVDESDQAEEKALGYKRKKKKGPAGPPVNMKKLMGGW